MSHIYKFFASYFSGIVAYFAAKFSIRVARIAAFMVAYIGLLTALFLLAKALVLGLVYSIDSPYFWMGYFLAWPDNAEVVFSTVIGFDLAVMIYKAHRAQLRETLRIWGF